MRRELSWAEGACLREYCSSYWLMMFLRLWGLWEGLELEASELKSSLSMGLSSFYLIMLIQSSGSGSALWYSGSGMRRPSRLASLRLEVEMLPDW